MPAGTLRNVPAHKLEPSPEASSSFRLYEASRSAQLIDLFALCAVSYFSSLLTSAPSLNFVAALRSNITLCGCALGFIQVLACKRLAFYAPRPAESIVHELKILLKSATLAQLLVMASLFALRASAPVPGLLLSIGAVSLAWMLFSAQLRYSNMNQSHREGSLRKNVLIIGYSEVGRSLANCLRANSAIGCELVGFLDDEATGPEIVGATSDIEHIIRARFIDEIYVTSYSNRELVKALTYKAPSLGVDVSIVPDLFDGVGWNAPVDRVGHFPVLVLHRKQQYALQRFVKRLIDIGTSAMGLVVAAPILVLVAACIKLDSRGPVLHKSARVGRKGKIFTCYKFRSMEKGADEKLSVLAHLNERTGPLFKISNDPRVTRIGRWLRKYSIDELPQLINVLRGEMSLVGPRPPALEEYRQFKLEHLRKLDVIPGITGLWQVTSRTDPSFQSYIRCDLEYIENWSLWLDFDILARTAVEVIRGTGV